MKEPFYSKRNQARVPTNFELVVVARTIDPDQGEAAHRDIAKARIDFVRCRALHVCIALQSLELDALQLRALDSVIRFTSGGQRTIGTRSIGRPSPPRRPRPARRCRLRSSTASRTGGRSRPTASASRCCAATTASSATTPPTGTRTRRARA
jgi:hypothetical protein